MYLFNIIDWFSRKVIDYEFSNTLEKGFVLRCLRRAFSRCKPEIMNSDQGSHFTNKDYLELLDKEDVKVSMDGKGKATDISMNSRIRERYVKGSPSMSNFTIRSVLINPWTEQNQISFMCKQMRQKHPNPFNSREGGINLFFLQSCLDNGEHYKDPDSL